MRTIGPGCRSIGSGRCSSGRRVPAEDRFVGQVEQMHESRCFRASGAGSVASPATIRTAPGTRARRRAYYRDRCLECHADRGCSLPAAVRLRQSRDNDCIGCHMPRLGAPNPPCGHDESSHPPPRRTTRDRSPIPAEGCAAADGPWSVFHGELMDERERAEAERDIGVALCRDGPEGAAVALPLLEAALAARPDDVTAWEAKAFVLGQLGRGEEAMAAFRRALARSRPGNHADGSGLPSPRRWGGARTPSPTGGAPLPSAPGVRITTPSWPSSSFRPRLAQAAEACRETLRLNPANPRPASCSSGPISAPGYSGRPPGIADPLGFDPPDRDELIRWFASCRGDVSPAKTPSRSLSASRRLCLIAPKAFCRADGR